jgi:acetylornithine deacetylase/succinyl-diaminopimelate desuccinylase-like protein
MATTPISESTSAARWVEEYWEAQALPLLSDYIRIPNVSPAYEPEWSAQGHMDAAAQLLCEWARRRPIDGLSVELVQLDGLTPVLIAEVEASGDGAGSGSVLLYGHLDKQPPMTGWAEGLSPFEPTRRDDRLYGRGSADDGYAMFAALGAIEAAQALGTGHARCVVLIEASEESGSPHLPSYMDALAARIGSPTLVVALDSGCATWDRLWVTTSLRGNLIAALRVAILTEGIHSGASGVVPSSFRILRNLLDRVEDSASGDILPPELSAVVPPERLAEMADVASLLGTKLADYPWVQGARPRGLDPLDWLRGHTWEPALSITGMDGIPPVKSGGNVLRPSTTAKLSVRLPPTTSAATASEVLTRVLTNDAPYGAEVDLEIEGADDGWSAPPNPAWLAEALDAASREVFGQPPGFAGEGGSIPFVGALGKHFPDAATVVTGVLGPDTNAHGPNEFLHVPTARAVTQCVAQLLSAHARRTA